MVDYIIFSCKDAFMLIYPRSLIQITLIFLIINICKLVVRIRSIASGQRRQTDLNGQSTGIMLSALERGKGGS